MLSIAIRRCNAYLKGVGHINAADALFLGVMPKGELLRAFAADIFFHDQQGQIESAAAHVEAAHVPHVIMSKKTKS